MLVGTGPARHMLDESSLHQVERAAKPSAWCAVLCVRMSVCASVCVHVCVCVSVCVSACACVCLCQCVCLCACVYMHIVCLHAFEAVCV